MNKENENKRVEELLSYEIMDTFAEADLEEITKLASIICETSLSYIGLIDHSRVWFKSVLGLNYPQLPKEYSICQHTIEQDDLIIINDILLDDRDILTPFKSKSTFRFYAGMPLVTLSGYKIGTLCVLDRNPKSLDEKQKDLLKTLAKHVMKYIEFRKNNKELLKLNAKIEFFKCKEEFFSNMSHELRTPLNALSGFTDLLSKTKLDKNQTEYVGILRSSVDYLITIINDMLDYSKIDSGNLKIEKHTFNLRALIKAAYELLKIKAQEKSLSFSVDICKTIPSYINGDKIRLNQILMNLLGNAIKFTNKGSVGLKLKMVKDSEEEMTLSFTVRDTGIGIPSDKINDIFDRFQQIEGTTRVFGGSGLGLNIVKNLVELQNGKIEVNSELGKYSEFIFSISYQKSTEEEISNFIKEEKSTRPQTKPDLKGIRILLAEDNLLNVKLAEKVFEGTGAHLETSENGKVCIEKLKVKKYDLILMDIYMPEMDGYQATQYIRNTLKLNIPIVALSANISELLRKKCIDAGMDDYLTKPYKIEELFRVIYKFCKLKKDDNKVSSSKNSLPIDIKTISQVRSIVHCLKSNMNLSPDRFKANERSKIKIKLKIPKFKIKNKSEYFPLPKIKDTISFANSKDKWVKNTFIQKESLIKFSKNENLETFNIESLKEYSGDNKEFEKEFIDVFLLEVPEHFKELELEISKENYEAIKKLAHKLKSPMGIFGFSILKNKLEKIEEFSEKSQIVPIIKLVGFCKNNLEKILHELKLFIENYH